MTKPSVFTVENIESQQQTISTSNTGKNKCIIGAVGVFYLTGAILGAIAIFDENKRVGCAIGAAACFIIGTAIGGGFKKCCNNLQENARTNNLVTQNTSQPNYRLSGYNADDVRTAQITGAKLNY